MTEWKEHYVCDCGWYTEPAFGDPEFVREAVCPDCGTCIDHDISGAYRMKTRRWVSTAQLLKPWTWATGHWEERA